MSSINFFGSSYFRCISEAVYLGQNISHWQLGCWLQLHSPTLLLLVHWNPVELGTVSRRHNHNTRSRVIMAPINSVVTSPKFSFYHFKGVCLCLHIYVLFSLDLFRGILSVDVGIIRSVNQVSIDRVSGGTVGDSDSITLLLSSLSQCLKLSLILSELSYSLSS